ncbi:uncharacterized protein EI90DRAFT_1027965 [Cantharellus anzutake]|uniref:uncharacterized protein n=1 Tax=Cantharellus anzutake TaxID=1750568 RepID=UPI001907A270|nr:uncharacterized protein EI90DRAFT_1027965 [Cantharellus anzutake]KAF8331503.1 hypothetical protein EI90DRAFT_1027965 [Cantharellus anzutake]
MNTGASSYANGYTPVQFNYAPAADLYGTLLDDGWYPSEQFCRLTDAIFFYLDRNADSPNKNSGWIEPEKNLWWSQTMGTIPISPEQNRYIAQYAMASLYSTLGIPFHTVESKKTSKGPRPRLDRQGFLYSVISGFKVNPAMCLQKVNNSITRWGLHDPATNQPFPGPIPPSAVPSQWHWQSRSAFQSWQQTTAFGMRQHQIQKWQRNKARSHMVHSAFKMLTGGHGGAGLGGGLGGGFGGGFGGMGL